MKKRLSAVFCLMIICICAVYGCGEKNNESDIKSEVNASDINIDNSDNDEAAEGTSENMDDPDKKGSNEEAVGGQALNESGDTENNILHSENNSIPEIKITTDYSQSYSDDGTLLYTGEICSAAVSNEGFERLDAALKEDFSYNPDGDSDILADAQEQYEAMKDMFFGYEDTQSLIIARADKNILSMFLSYYGYYGGAHGFYGIDGYTYDVNTGKKLKLADILTDADAFYNVAGKYVYSELLERIGEGLYPDAENIISEMWTSEPGVQFYLDAAGIHLIYNIYEVGPYAVGMSEVILPYADFGVYIKEEYRTFDTDYIAFLPSNTDVSKTLGVEAPLMIEATSDDAEFNGINILQGLNSIELDCSGYFEKAYVMKQGSGDIRLLISADYASDDYFTKVFDITDDGIKELSGLDNINIEGSGISFDRITVSEHLDVLGTYEGIAEYEITDGGELVRLDDIIQINSRFPLVVKKALPVIIDNQKTTIAAGESITITGTDNKGTAYFSTADGRKGSISYIRSSQRWELIIDGISETEYFESLPYAG